MTDYSILKDKLLNELRHDIKLNAGYERLENKIKSGKVNYADVGEFSKSLGDSVAKKLEQYVAEGVAKEELEAFANEFLTPIYRDMQGSMLNACRTVQEIMNEEAGIGLNPVDVATDESRLKHIRDRFAEAEDFEDVRFLTEKNVSRSIARSSVSDSIKANSKAHEDAGLEIVLSRSDGSGCCDWCSGQTGVFHDFDELPDGFWQIHRGCSCVIDYRVGKTKTRLNYVTNDDGSLSKITTEL